jgi:hypothetical protein
MGKEMLCGQGMIHKRHEVRPSKWPMTDSKAYQFRKKKIMLVEMNSEIRKAWCI